MSEITGDWAETKASYRFFENERVTKSEILAPHIHQTGRRVVGAQQVVLVIQDTTYLNYTHCPRTEGLGKLARPKKHSSPLMGLVMHCTLAVTPHGKCLGLLDQKIYRRGDEDIRKTNKTRPIENKESYRWIQSVRQVSSLCAGSEVVHVCDREGDIFELFLKYPIKLNIIS